MPNNAADIIFFNGAGFSKILAALPLKRIWALAGGGTIRRDVEKFQEIARYIKE
ncbi:unnamed protein product [marine sediment metagenome]|uniref:Uncharacterized protein n=1 Tax=marine sediment metagenome TaxID=412755 RepID=X1VGE9_9ZZZZ